MTKNDEVPDDLSGLGSTPTTLFEIDDYDEQDRKVTIGAMRHLLDFTHNLQGYYRMSLGPKVFGRLLAAGLSEGVAITDIGWQIGHVLKVPVEGPSVGVRGPIEHMHIKMELASLVITTEAANLEITIAPCYAGEKCEFEEGGDGEDS